MSDEDLIDALGKFIDWNVYNGAPGKGQNIYNEGGNPWLHAQVAPFVDRLRGRASWTWEP